MNITLGQIAKEHLELDTLNTQNSDELDFQPQAVWQIHAALAAAYTAGGQVTVKFARKPLGMADVVAAAKADTGESYPVQIQGHQRLTASEYADFITNLLHDYPWLAGKGGWVNQRTRQAIKVTCAGQPTLFVDPSGSAYGRYVGFEV